MLKEYATENIRTVAIVGHGSTGKSTLFDAMLFASGQIEKIGKPDDGSLTSDYDEEEKARKMSIRSALGFVELDDVKINIIDTPGMSDFVGEARAAIQIAEAAIIVVDAVDGVQIETEKVWRYLESKKIPRIIFVNKMDKERANFAGILDNLKSHFNAKFAALCLPVGEADKHSGVIDLIEMKAMFPKPDGKVQVADVPADLKKAAEDARNSLMELSAEGDDALIEKYLEGELLTEEEMKKGLKALVAKAEVFPVLCGSSLKATGIKNLLNVIKTYVPAWELNKNIEGINPNNKEEKVVITTNPDGPLAAVVWKTYIDQYAGRFNYLKIVSGKLLPETEVLNSKKNYKERINKLYTMVGNKQVEVSKLLPGDIGVVVKLDRTSTLDTLCDTKQSVLLPIVQLPHPVFSYAVHAAKKGDEDKIGQIFSRITDENPTITYVYNPETRQTVLSGMGEMQLDIILKSIKEKNKIDLITSEPKVAYRETITKKAEAQYKHKKQTGGHGQYGEVFIRLAPLERGKGFEFIDSIVGGVIPRNFIPAVEKGLREGMERGVLARCPVVDISVELYYGSYHDVDSSEMSFKIAAIQALKKGMETAGPILLEPIMEVDIYVDKEYMGDILNDITSRRGRVLGMGSADEDGNSPISVVKALVPLAEMLRYSIDLRAMTSGKATFEMRFSHYDPVPPKIAEKVIEERKKEFAEEEANK